MERYFALNEAASVLRQRCLFRDKLAVDGLVTKYTYAWTGLSPGFTKLIKQDKPMAWNLPLGVMSHMIRYTLHSLACLAVWEWVD